MFDNLFQVKNLFQEKLVQKEILPEIPTTFKLPITYLDSNRIHLLSETVSNDLELFHSPTNNAMYNQLFKPKNGFANKMIPEWNKHFTTDVAFLEDTKQVLQDMPKFKELLSTNTNTYSVDYDKLTEIWTHTKTNPEFLTKYSYIEWDFLKQFNQSSSFLQYVSFIQLMSPLISLFLPVLLLLFPFLILKAQGMPITFELYSEVLKSIASNHFIGKALSSMDTLTPDKVVYIVFTMGIYLFQIYQNMNQCNHFYKNIYRINDYLLELQKYIQYSIHSMTNFIEIHRNKVTFTPFLTETGKYVENLQCFYNELVHIQPFEYSFSKIGELGYMLKCFYELHSNQIYEKAISYSFGFEGYINNLLGVAENLEEGIVSFSQFDTSGNCNIVKQYYPILCNNDTIVKNNIEFDKNIIISAPNAGGKTTMIKTTAINIIFSQQLGCGFYKSCVLNPYTHIHSYLNIPDTSERDSLFQAESRRCKDIIDIIQENNTVHHRHFCIFDELYSGTNPTEATKSAYAFLTYLSKFSNVNFMLTTHYITICKKFIKSDRIQNYKMLVHELDSGVLDYTYKMKRGISKIQGAITILKQLNYPQEIIDTIASF